MCTAKNFQSSGPKHVLENHWSVAHVLKRNQVYLRSLLSVNCAAVIPLLLFGNNFFPLFQKVGFLLNLFFN